MQKIFDIPDPSICIACGICTLASPLPLLLPCSFPHSLPSSPSFHPLTLLPHCPFPSPSPPSLSSPSPHRLLPLIHSPHRPLTLPLPQDQKPLLITAEETANASPSQTQKRKNKGPVGRVKEEHDGDSDNSQAGELAIPQSTAGSFATLLQWALCTFV